jgi:hypothetical protein
MFNRGAVCGAVLSAGIMAALIGCQSKQEDRQVIRVVRNIGGREGFRLHWEAWKAAFERDNPGWSMELINVGDNNGSEFYQTRIATNDLPEVIQTWDTTQYLADNGHLLPLPDEYYKKFGMALPSAYKGKRYASMGGMQVLGIAVNRKMWAKIGVTEPPATWDAFIDALARLKAAGYKPLTYGAREWPAAVPLGMAIHTNIYDFLGETIDVNSLQTVTVRRCTEVATHTFTTTFTPAQGQPMRGGHDGLLEVFHGHHGILDGFDRCLDARPVGFDDLANKHQQVGPHGKPLRLVADDHSHEVFLHDL